jgi:hypothetical protein
MQTYPARQSTVEARMNSVAASTNFLRSGLDVLLHHALVLPLLRRCLVGTVSELGRGVDPLELNLLKRPPAGVDEHGFAQSHDALLDTRAVTLEQNEVVLDLTVADETTHAIVCQN